MRGRLPGASDPTSHGRTDMAYRRGKRKTWSFQARTAGGWKQLSTGATDRVLTARMEAMWERAGPRVPSVGPAGARA